MSALTIANLLLIFAMVSYFAHAYFHNTVDFLYYRTMVAVPVANVPMKYVYIHSFYLCVLSAALFIFNVVLYCTGLGLSPVTHWVLGGAVVLALGAARLITMPNIARWPKRAE